MNETKRNQYEDSFLAIGETFRAFVDAVIPRTPQLAVEYGKIQYFGALDLHTDEYIIITLNRYYVPLAVPTAAMLDVAARQLELWDGGKRIGATFAMLSPRDRFRALVLLEQGKVYKEDLPLPFQSNHGWILSITSVLDRYTLMGYYSEWSGYGSTRLMEPTQRKLEYFPLSWKQVGYPGPSFGYRALREVNA